MMIHTLFALLVVIVVVNGNRSCICTAVYDPWCGKKGTYGNLCELMCAGDKIVGHGTCENIKACLKAYPDPPEDPVCAEFGITFGSIEEMECHNLTLVHYGKCEKGDDLSEVGNGKRSCICPAVYDPWCGEEGTYGNLCELKCAGDEIKGHDTCENIEECMKAYPDLPEYPVCAEFGITFDSIEEMECHNLKFVHDGECEEGPEPDTPDQ